MQISRRNFGKIAAMSAASSALSSNRILADPPKLSDEVISNYSFPKGFLWGTATSSYQIEGAVKEDGRGPTIWDTFSHLPGKTAEGDTGDAADDSYHRYAEDIAIMKSLGVRAYRFSIAWSRIFPEGAGSLNQKGIDHYRKVAELLLKEDIQPFCTLYHWDLPQALEDKGGWQNRDTAKTFADYAGYTAGKLSDLITIFMTMNEMATFTSSGYGNGRFAPGLKLEGAAIAQVRHNALLGHGLAVQAIRAGCPRTVRVGSAENLRSVVPAFNAPEHIEAARKTMVEENARFLTVIHMGRYTERYLKRLGANAPKFTSEDLKIISSPIDFQGLNIYTSEPVRSSSDPAGYTVIPKPASYPHMASSWLSIGPEALYWVPKLVADVFDVKEIYITENGCSADDKVEKDGEIYDTDRVMYLDTYLIQLQRCVEEGVPVKGYFLWSLLDNFEWADGYEKRFGITYVDFETQKRTPKMSAKYYRDVILKNGL
jgi:beta-glucosidase